MFIYRVFIYTSRPAHRRHLETIKLEMTKILLAFCPTTYLIPLVTPVWTLTARMRKVPTQLVWFGIYVLNERFLHFVMIFQWKQMFIMQLDKCILYMIFSHMLEMTLTWVVRKLDRFAARTADQTLSNF